MTDSNWERARNADIEAIKPELLCRNMAPDVQPGQSKPCYALTPSDVRLMLYERTGITGWKVRIVGVNLLEILPPDEPQ